MPIQILAQSFSEDTPGDIDCALATIKNSTQEAWIWATSITTDDLEAYVAANEATLHTNILANGAADADLTAALQLNNEPLFIYNGATKVAEINLLPVLKLGSDVDSLSYGSGSGIWLGNDGGTYKAFIGDSAGDNFTYDGTNITVTGGLTTSDGDITLGDSGLTLNTSTFRGINWLNSVTNVAHIHSDNTGDLEIQGDTRVYLTTGTAEVFITESPNEIEFQATTVTIDAVTTLDLQPTAISIASYITHSQSGLAGDYMHTISNTNINAHVLKLTSADTDTGSHILRLESGTYAPIFDVTCSTVESYAPVGIGVSPSTALHIKGSGVTGRELRIEADDDDPGFRFVDSLGNRWLFQFLGSADDRARFLSPSGNEFAFEDGGAFTIPDGVTAPSATAGRAKIYVDSADGDLKVKFADGTTKTLATDT